MSFGYASIAATTQRLLQQFGASTTLTRSEPGEYDPDDGFAPLVDAVQTVTAAVFPVEDRFVDGTLIFATDQQAYLSAVGVTEPKPGDVLAWNGASLTAVRCKNLGPAGTFVLYEMIVRAT